MVSGFTEWFRREVLPSGSNSEAESADRTRTRITRKEYCVERVRVRSGGAGFGKDSEFLSVDNLEGISTPFLVWED